MHKAWHQGQILLESFYDKKNSSYLSSFFTSKTLNWPKCHPTLKVQNASVFTIVSFCLDFSENGFCSSQLCAQCIDIEKKLSALKINTIRLCPLWVPVRCFAGSVTRIRRFKKHHQLGASAANGHFIHSFKRSHPIPTLPLSRKSQDAHLEHKTFLIPPLNFQQKSHEVPR